MKAFNLNTVEIHGGGEKGGGDKSAIYTQTSNNRVAVFACYIFALKFGCFLAVVSKCSSENFRQIIHFK
jgi:hypothetical protein